jgi:hypothetical protein
MSPSIRVLPASLISYTNLALLPVSQKTQAVMTSGLLLSSAFDGIAVPALGARRIFVFPVTRFHFMKVSPARNSASSLQASYAASASFLLSAANQFHQHCAYAGPPSAGRIYQAPASLFSSAAMPAPG